MVHEFLILKNMKMSKNLLFILTISFFISCNSSPEGNSYGYSSGDEATTDAAQDVAEETSVNGLVSNGATSSAEPESEDKTNKGIVLKDAASSAEAESVDKTKSDLTTTSPKLIKNGYLTLEVKNYKESHKKIKDLVIKNGGYLGNETESNESYRILNELTIRIPSKVFDQMMEGLMAEGIKTDSKRIEVQDVGEEYADLTARIETKKAVEKRYLEILNKAYKISDILEVEEKLRVIREEIEAAQGRVKYLESQVSFSTIYLNFYKTLDTHYTPPSGPGFFTRIWKGLVKGWEGVLEFFVAIAYLWPIWIVIALVIIWIRRRHFKFRIWPFRKKQP